MKTHVLLHKNGFARGPRDEKTPKMDPKKELREGVRGRVNPPQRLRPGVDGFLVEFGFPWYSCWSRFGYFFVN